MGAGQIEKFNFLDAVIAIVVLFFFSQVVFNYNIVPADVVAAYLGAPSDFSSIFLSIISFILIFQLLDFLLKLAYSTGFSKKLSFGNSVIRNFYRVFFSLFLSMFSISMFSLMGFVKANTIEEFGFVFPNLYLGFFLLICFIEKTIKVVRKAKVSTKSISMTSGETNFEKYRITWISYFFGKTVVSQTKESLGTLVYSETQNEKSLINKVKKFILTLISLALIISFFSIIFNGIAELLLSAEPQKELTLARILLEILFAIPFHSAVLFFIGYFLLSKKPEVYSNAILVPMPIFDDLDFFSAVLPKGFIIINPLDINSYKLFSRVVYRNKTNELKSNFIKITFVSKETLLVRISSKKTMLFGRALTHVLNKTKIESLGKGESSIINSIIPELEGKM